MKMSVYSVLKDIVKVYWKLFVIVLTPVLLSPLPIVIQTNEAKCAFVLIWMAIYWSTEVIPLAVTAFFPIFLFPFLEILEAKRTCQNYLKDSNFLFVGGLIVALGIEECYLHRRIALAVLLRMGSQPRWLMLGFMCVTCFLSMWMSNTATTAMMVPIAMAVVQELLRYEISVEPNEFELINMENKEEFQIDNEHHIQSLSHAQLRMTKGVLLSICYAANIGGTGSLTGTVPNIIVLNNIHERYNNTGLTYASWMGFAVPEMILLLFISWIWLQFCFLGMKPIEMIVITLFTLLVFLWIFRSPKFIPGWGATFKTGYVSDAVPSMLIACSLFMIPKNIVDVLMFRKDDTGERIVPNMLLTWKVMQQRFPWSVIMLLGGGFALADGVGKSGLSQSIGDFLKQQLGEVHPVAVISIAVIVVTFLTEFVSNTATAIIFIPILLDLAHNMHVHPLYFVLPVGIATSFAFCMPVATPPNAIVFGTGLLRVVDMVIAGIGMNFIGIAVCLLTVNTWTTAIFDLNQFPSWAQNLTAATTTPKTG